MAVVDAMLVTPKPLNNESVARIGPLAEDSKSKTCGAPNADRGIVVIAAFESDEVTQIQAKVAANDADLTIAALQILGFKELDTPYRPLTTVR